MCLCDSARVCHKLLLACIIKYQQSVVKGVYYFVFLTETIIYIDHICCDMPGLGLIITVITENYSVIMYMYVNIRVNSMCYQNNNCPAL